MEFANMPKDLELIVKTSDQDRIGHALKQALGTAQEFNFCEPIYGTDRSGRLFSVIPHPQGKPMQQRLSPRSIASELMRLHGQVRYDRDPRKGEKPGWEVYTFKINGSPAAIAWATWTHE